MKILKEILLTCNRIKQSMPTSYFAVLSALTGETEHESERSASVVLNSSLDCIQYSELFSGTVKSTEFQAKKIPAINWV